MVEKNILGWWLVRSIAELHVLTKATYTILILVPILAGIWSTAIYTVNGYNQQINYNIEKLGVLIDSIDREKYSKDNFFSIKKNIIKINDFLEAMTIQEKRLPSIWVFAFISALTAVIGQIVYSIFAPQRIKDFSAVNYTKFIVDRDLLTEKENFKKEESFRVANEKYIVLSNENRKAAIASIMFYTFSILSIFAVIFLQFSNILKAAGWIS